MAYSLTFNAVDLSAYGLSVNTLKSPMLQEASYAQLKNRARAWDSHKPPRVITLDISIVAASLTTLKTYLDSIKGVLNEDDDKSLALESYTDRYWLARFNSLAGSVMSPTLFQGTLGFICHDPLAYSNTETTDGPTAIDADPKTITVTTLGTANIRPVISFTAGAAMNNVTLLLENTTTSEELTWGAGTGDIVNGKVWEVDCPNWVVTNDATAEMDTAGGQFPTLAPSVANSIKFTGFGAAGSVTIVYRNRYV